MPKPPNQRDFAELKLKAEEASLAVVKANEDILAALTAQEERVVTLKAEEEQVANLKAQEEKLVAAGLSPQIFDAAIGALSNSLKAAEDNVAVMGLKVKEGGRETEEKKLVASNAQKAAEESLAALMAEEERLMALKAEEDSRVRLKDEKKRRAILKAEEEKAREAERRNAEAAGVVAGGQTYDSFDAAARNYGHHGDPSVLYREDALVRAGLSSDNMRTGILRCRLEALVRIPSP